MLYVLTSSAVFIPQLKHMPLPRDGFKITLCIQTGAGSGDFFFILINTRLKKTKIRFR